MTTQEGPQSEQCYLAKMSNDFMKVFYFFRLVSPFEHQVKQQQVYQGLSIWQQGTTVVLIGSLPEARATKFSAEWQLPNGISTLHSAVQPQQPGMHYAKCATLFMVILKLPCSSKHLHSYTCTSKRRNLREGMHFVNAGLACDPESFLYQWTVCYS